MVAMVVYRLSATADAMLTTKVPFGLVNPHQSF